MNLLNPIRRLLGHGDDDRNVRTEVRSRAKHQAREALATAGASRTLRELEIADAQYRLRLRGKGRWT